MVHTVVNPDRDTVELWHPGGMGFNDSSSSPYKDTINDILCMQGKEGAYGAGWGTVSLPLTPSDFKTVVRRNTDTNTMRLYTYNGSAWQYVEFT